MKTLAKYYVYNRCVIGEKTFKNILNGPGNLAGLSRNGPQGPGHYKDTVSMLSTFPWQRYLAQQQVSKIHSFLINLTPC